MTPEERQQVMDFIGEEVIHSDDIIHNNTIYFKYRAMKHTFNTVRCMFPNDIDGLVATIRLRNNTNEYICEAINEKLSRDRAEAQLKQETKK